MSESSGPGPSPAPSPSLTAVGPEGSSGALPDLTELRRLAEAATPGPWHSCRDEFGCGTVAPGVDCSSSQSFVATEIAETADADYIAAAHPQAVLALLNRIRDLERDNDMSFGCFAMIADDLHAMDPATPTDQVPPMMLNDWIRRVFAVQAKTNQRLNRRCQQAEAAAARSAESVKAELYGRRPGKPLGRMLANIRLTELEAAADALAEACDPEHAGKMLEPECPICAALAAYRAVRSPTRKAGDAP